MINSTPLTSGSELVMSAQEAAWALRISARTLWTHTNRGEIPHVRVGRRILYPVAELREWLRRRMDEQCAER